MWLLKTLFKIVVQQDYNHPTHHPIHNMLSESYGTESEEEPVPRTLEIGK